MPNFSSVCYQIGVPLHARLRPLLQPFAALLLAAALVVAGPGSARGAVLPTLYVTYVGTNCTFTLVSDSGANVTAIAPGTYQLTLAATDFESCGPTNLPSFQLSGPGVLVQSPIDAGTGAAADYTVTFQPSSTYLAQDLNQPLSKITFTTLASGTPPVVNLPTTPPKTVTTTSSSAAPIGTKAGPKSSLVFRGTLEGIVSAAGKPTLSFKGKTVTQLTAGKYTLRVDDKSKSGGFLIQEPPRIATSVTGLSFVGTRMVTIDLTAGQAIFYPTFIGRKSYFIVVAA